MEALFLLSSWYFPEVHKKCGQATEKCCHKALKIGGILRGVKWLIPIETGKLIAIIYSYK
ncbi:hypothetical protein NUBL2908_50630 [Klebsiella pneumoniae]|nr:hypothetical protein NUBL2899_20110 [Klebsiella pneumoniae]GKI95160.1 hypothetical protein NUBL2908_50630 [Klebsiella pneumoniae]GKP95238.1 hypothetical protein NUBL2886_48040 [Klebsiella pneumoniae]